MYKIEEFPKISLLYIISQICSICIFEIIFKIEDMYILSTSMFILSAVATGIFYLIYLFGKSRVKQNKFSTYILDRSIFHKYHHERNIQFNIMNKFIRELYWSSEYTKIRNIIMKFDKSLFRGGRKNPKNDFILFHVEGKLFCSFKLDSYNEIISFYLSETHYLYDDYNEILYDD